MTETTHIRPVRYSDQGGLLEAFPQTSAQRFQHYQLEHMLDQRLMLVICEVIEQDGERIQRIYGYITLLWTSEYTRFWQRNIPEIVEMNLVPDYQQTPTMQRLIDACEAQARQRGHQQLGWHLLEETPLHDFIQDGLADLGFVADGNQGIGTRHFRRVIKARL